ncbi:hypothetical protein [Mycolicibacterium neworleansense]
MQQSIPTSDPEAMAKAVWALVHGLAFLHLDGKFDASSPDAVAATVRARCPQRSDSSPDGPSAYQLAFA